MVCKYEKEACDNEEGRFVHSKGEFGGAGYEPPMCITEATDCVDADGNVTCMSWGECVATVAECESENNYHLSMGVILAIVLGIVGGLVICLLYCCCFGKKEVDDDY